MVSLEHIRALEARIEKAVLLIHDLRRENAAQADALRASTDIGEARRQRIVELEARTDDLSRRLDEMSDRSSAAETRAQALEARAVSAETSVAELEGKAADDARTQAALVERARIAEERVAELETRAEDLRREQARIEEGIVHALEKLDAFEDLVLGGAAASVAGANGSSGGNPHAVSRGDAYREGMKDPGSPGEDPAEAAQDVTTPIRNVGAGSDAYTERNRVDPATEPERGFEEETTARTPAVSPSAGPEFPGAENELDIF